MAKLTPIETHCAHWGYDEHRYFGYRVFDELLGRESFTGVMALSVLGRRLPPEAIAVMDCMAVAITLADPRIWPLKMTRVLASYGSSVRAAGAGMMVQEGARIGAWTSVEAGQLLVDFHAQLANGSEPVGVEAIVRAYLAEHRFVWGFGTPFRARDERLVALRVQLERMGRCQLPYWQTFEAVSRVVVEARQTAPNIGMGFAAAFLDLGLTPRDIGPLAAALMQHMFLANAIEEAKSPSSALRQLPEESVAYVGRAPRPSQRALQHDPEPR